MTQDLEREEYVQKKKDVSMLRTQLISLNTDKEKVFQELRSLGQQTKPLMGQINKIKQERDELTTKVKTLKEEREKLNETVKEKAHEKQEVMDKQKGLVRDSPSTENPGRIKAEIARLEMKIQTEVIPFEKEQQFTKHIKELKLKLKQLEQLGLAWREASTASAGFSHARQKANDMHQEIQVVAQQSQEKHQQMNGLYDQIKKLRQQEKPLKQKYGELKAQWEGLKKTFDETVARANELAKLFHEEEETSFKAKAREKSALVQEKLKSGKKLRMEDILAFQASKE